MLATKRAVACRDRLQLRPMNRLHVGPEKCHRLPELVVMKTARLT
jgi:hypothetical protein